MPVVDVVPGPRADDNLIDRVVAAMAADAHKPGEPQVYVTSADRRILGKHVYVVWTHWGDADTERRAEIVYEAYARFAPHDVGNVTLAMGLTPVQWRRLGLVAADQGVRERRG